MVNDGPLLSPRGRGYLARLVLEVCSEIEDSKKVGVGMWEGNMFSCGDFLLGSKTVPMCEVAN